MWAVVGALFGRSAVKGRQVLQLKTLYTLLLVVNFLVGASMCSAWHS